MNSDKIVSGIRAATDKYISRGCSPITMEEANKQATEMLNYAKKHKYIEKQKPKIKAVYPVKSESLCKKCEYSYLDRRKDKSNCLNCNISTTVAIITKKQTGCRCSFIKDGQICIYFIRKPSQFESKIKEFYSEELIRSIPSIPLKRSERK